MATNKIHTVHYFVLGLTLLLSINSRANVRLPAIFSDHMVLQQRAKVHIWGWASPGEQINVSVPWQKKNIEGRTDNTGNWNILVQTPAAGGPYDIKISGKNSIALKDILIGEVWFCSGQSNMVFPLKYSDSAKAEIARANDPLIRYFSVKKQFGSQPFKDSPGSVWEKTSSETAPSFSAVAYYFAKKVHHDTTVPVGIICSAWSGTPAEAWTPKSVLQKDSSFQFYLRRWNDIPKTVGADSMAYHLALTKWKENNNSAGNSAKKPDLPRTVYYYQKPWCEPGALFNGMVNPMTPYTIKGVLWYQGESNVGEADNYEHLFTAMIKSWRHQWGLQNEQNRFPFYFVQIAPFGYGDLDAAARLREAQYNVMKKINNTGMAVTIDVGNMNNIHFTHKKEVGERLALVALAKSYGFKNIVFEGPVCKKFIKVKDQLQLNFDQQLFTAGHQEPDGFEIGYKNPDSDSLIFVKAQLIIKGSKVIVWNNRVKDPLIVRYAWLEAGNANLVNKTGLPAYPFQQKFYNPTK